MLQLATSSLSHCVTNFRAIAALSTLAVCVSPFALHAQSVGVANAAVAASDGGANVMISARSLAGQCSPAPAGTAYMGGIAVEMKNAGNAAISAKGVQATLSLSIDNKQVRKISLSNPSTLAAGSSAFAAKNGRPQVWFPITAQAVTEYMTAHQLSAPPATIPVKLELESVRSPATANLGTVALDVALARDASLCGFLKSK